MSLYVKIISHLSDSKLKDGVRRKLEEETKELKLGEAVCLLLKSQMELVDSGDIR